MVQIRPAAAQEINRLLHSQTSKPVSHAPQIYLFLKPDGCADWTYCLAAEPPSPQPTTLVHCNDICLAIPTAQLGLLTDLTIDYAEDLMGGGFRFTNPLAQRTCGCGNAFSLSADAPITQDCSITL